MLRLLYTKELYIYNKKKESIKKKNTLINYIKKNITQGSLVRIRSYMPTTATTSKIVTLEGEVFKIDLNKYKISVRVNYSGTEVLYNLKINPSSMHSIVRIN